MTSFVQTIEVSKYPYKQSPILPGSERLFVDREIRGLSEKINNIVDAIQEIQAHLKVNFP